MGGLAMGSLIGCGCAAILGYLYARGSVLIDDERFAVLATIAFGASIGACAATAWYGERSAIKPRTSSFRPGLPCWDCT